MGFHECAARVGAAALLMASVLQAGTALAQTQAPAWQDYLKRPSIERVQISPDGQRLAVAERVGDSTTITVRNAQTFAIERRFDSGSGGEIHALRWLDDERMLVAANKVYKKYNIALNDPVMAIVSRDGKSRQLLPANFLAVIDGDPDHLLVAKCTNWGEGGCVDAVHKVEIGHLARLGEKIIDAPDRDSALHADRQGNVRFAVAVDDKGHSKLHAHSSKDKAWVLVNDSEKSNLHVVPLGVDARGDFAFIESEQEQGPSVVERYDFATGTRTQVYRNPESDVVQTIPAFDGQTPIGGYYEPTRPRAVVWNAQHPDAQPIAQILAAFPGKMATIVSATRDRAKAIVYTVGDRDAGTWYVYDRTAKRASLLARARNWLPEAMVPKSREFKLAARDGVPLHGVLTLPTSGVERNLPMIVIPHGGPHGVFDLAMFDSEAALLASQGYAVLRVNYRGSGGYGKAFEHSGYMQWGRAMQDDVTDATKWAIEQGIADAKRICLYGASYGGYAALMGGVREPGLYRCVAGYAAPYDLAKMYKWGSIRRSDLGLEYLARVIGKDEKVLAERSPSTQAASIKVPVFIAHGRIDGRVDVAHSRRMEKALRKAGVDVTFQEYLKAGHGLQIEADELDFYARLLAFVGKHTAPQ
jgi:dipeptidyl aminopeptidase/acylaminoacyl peptidase